MNREKYLYPRFPREWSRDECRIGHALLLALWTFFCDNSFFAVGNDFQFLYLYIWLIRVDNSLCGHCWEISSSLKWDAFFRSTNNVTLPDLPSKTWFHLLGYLFVRHVRTNNFVKWTLYITLGNDFFYSYGSYRESTAELQGPLNLTVSSYRTLSSEIHFADHRSKPGIYGGCLGEFHLYNSFTVICDLLASNST